jgi:serine/threonine-protein kinase
MIRHRRPAGELTIMSHPIDHSRDLLFGLLALQNGLINQAQLVAAFQAWTLDKAHALADHLVALGHLSDAQRVVVEAMADLHVAKHGDVERSLAAIPAGRSTHESLARLGDPDIEGTLARVRSRSTPQDREVDADRTATYSVGSATSDGQRFRVLRPHARGGLGAVFVALDTELHREVALKQLLDQHADDTVSRQRFLLEAEVTGGLEHPGIVPVYGLGTYGDGRPYYAMRFVRGDSLKESIERFHADTSLKNHPGRRSLELHKLLRRFTDVCNAIEYAHSRGVLHRDIKPGNVIVGRHGETLVVDWGLAKATGHADPDSGELTLLPSSASGSAETLPGSALGTPAYMSPEQSEGNLERLGPRSDVYSLGATLYCLLTGRPPLEGDVAEVLRAVQRGEFRPPRALDPMIDRALEAICVKAVALNPDDRYGSCRALAEDVERWMADEPVAAWPEPFSRRARRWARRHRTAVTTGVAAVLVALAGMATVLAVQTQANRELSAANAQTLRERDLARQNFDLARRAVDDYLTRVGQHPLLKEQGLHDLRQELLEAALGYYRNFLAQRGDDPSLRVETAAAHERVGDILLELGRFGDALSGYDQALALVEPLVRDRPGDPQLATAQVRLQAGRLQALGGGGWLPEAIATFERVKSLGEGLLTAGGGTEDLPEILARSYRDAGFVFRGIGRTDDALQAALRAYTLADRASRDHPGDSSAARTRLWVSAQAIHLLATKGQTAEARRLCEQSIAFGKASVHKHPRDVETRMHLAALEYNLGSIEQHLGRPLEAVRIVAGAAESLGALARENPLLIRVRSAWANALELLSSLQTDLGRYAEAEQSARRCIDVNEALVRDVPSSSYYRMAAGGGYGSLGKVHLKAGSHAEALAMLRKAVAILESSDEVIDLYNLACNLASASTIADPAEGPAAADRQRGDADRAAASIRRAIDLGYANSDSLKTDPDLDPLRSRPDFQLLMMDLAMPADPFAR